MIERKKQAIDDLERRLEDLDALSAQFTSALVDIHRRAAEIRQFVEMDDRTAGVRARNPRQLTLHMDHGEQLEFNLVDPASEYRTDRDA